MEELQSSLPGLGLVFVWLVVATVFCVQKVKMLVCTHFKGTWTQRIPKWFWLILSIVLPLALMLVMTIPWAQNLVNSVLPETWKIDVSLQDIVPLGLSATLGANGSYAVAKRLGLTSDYSAGGPNDVTPSLSTAVVAPGEITKEVPEKTQSQVSSAKARVFLEVDLGEGPDRFVLVEDESGQRLLRLS